MAFIVFSFSLKFQVSTIFGSRVITRFVNVKITSRRKQIFVSLVANIVIEATEKAFLG